MRITASTVFSNMQAYANGSGAHMNGRFSFASSSEASYGRTQVHSRSESGTSQTQYDDTYITPSPKTLIPDLTRPDLVMNGNVRMSSEYRRSLRVTSGDPMAMHLLLETALSDSQHYDIMSPDELDGLKKEERSLARNIKSKRKRLFLESKMHTTTKSLQRLDSHEGSGHDVNINAASPPQICVDLADELWRLERRQSELQSRRLQHTAGVLQLNQQLQSETDRSGDLDGAVDDVDDLAVLDGLLAMSGGAISAQLAERLQDVSRTLYGIIEGSKVNDTLGYPEPPQPGTSAVEELSYIETSLNTVKGMHDGFKSYLEDSQRKGRDHEQNVQQTHAVLTGLWDIIGPGAQDLQRNQQEARAIAASRGVEDDAELETLHDPSEPYSIQAFSAKVQALCFQAANLSEQHIMLQQELNNEREMQAIKIAEHSELTERMQDLHDQHLLSQRALENTRAQLAETAGGASQATQEMDFLRQQHEAEHASALAIMQSKIDAAHGLAAQHEAAALDFEAQMGVLGSNLMAAHQRIAAHDEAMAEKSRALDDAEADRGELEGELVRLQTELTISRAELDGAYGTRAQRALEGARAPKDYDAVVERNAQLQAELADLVNAHEGMVRQLLEAEKERERLEVGADAHKDRIEDLERTITDEKVRFLGYRSSSSEAGGSVDASPSSTRDMRNAPTDTTSVSVMREEFKKMAREMRSRHFQNLKSEQLERRRLEGIIRSLRKDPVHLSPVPANAILPAGALMSSPVAATASVSLSAAPASPVAPLRPALHKIRRVSTMDRHERLEYN